MTDHLVSIYDSIDPIIQAWLDRHALTLFTGTHCVKDISFRNVYLSSKHRECCQIWIDPPQSGLVAVHAEDVETLKDEEFRQDWVIPIDSLDEGLDDALAFVRKWMERNA